MKKIGFIGVGIMGKSMVRNLMKAGFDVAIYTRTKSKVEDVICEGAAWRDSVKECVADRDAVITIVGYPKDVEEVYFGEGGILKNAPTGAYVIDMTTSSPKLAERIYEEAKAVGLYALDAPVTGGDSGAKAGTLTILAGGDREAFDACMPVFEAMGKKGRKWTAYKDVQPDCDCRSTFRRLRGFGLCPGCRSGSKADAGIYFYWSCGKRTDE